ncbi:hypothetical protein BKA70DRAFT_1249462 [Coprinopsis sp. MPI-PUGE-AT-0042]|nr:hypothetical protein BKA70DRAFT_1249462 [Coprinopsis sp. MPI-PUGE-AT-0042]
MPSAPPLPAELWGEILREATVGLQYSQPWILPSLTPLQYVRWRKSMLTKRRIVLVCKHWYSLALPLLYEHIVLKRYERTELVATSAARMSSIDPALGPLGRYTKRLDIACPNNTVSSCHPFLALLENLSNLLTFTIQMHTFPTTTDFLSSLPSTLEYFEWKKSYDEHAFPKPLLIPFLDSHPNLRIACFPNFANNAASTGEVQAPSSGLISACQQLCIARPYSIPTFPHLPLLKSLGILRTFTTNASEFASFQRIIDSFGGSITSLFLGFGYISGYSARNTLLYSIEHCSSLQELFISVDDFDPPPDTCLFPEGALNHVELLAISFSGALTARSCSHLCTLLCDAKGKFPQLKAIRLFDERNIIHLRQNHAFRCRPIFEGLTREGLCLQDHTEHELIL